MAIMVVDVGFKLHVLTLHRPDERSVIVGVTMRVTDRNGVEHEVTSRLDLGKRWFIDGHDHKNTYVRGVIAVAGAAVAAAIAEADRKRNEERIRRDIKRKEGK